MNSQGAGMECPYAPRHRPTLKGICAHCLHEVPAPWFMRRQPDPVDLVGDVVARAGAGINRDVAEKIVAALFGYADRAYEVRQTVPRDAWQQPEYRAHVREHLRIRLFAEVASQGVLPTALPSEALRYLAHPWRFGDEDGGEVPRSAVDAGVPYEMVEVVLAVPVRRPPVDRAAAVRAGVL